MCLGNSATRVLLGNTPDVLLGNTPDVLLGNTPGVLQQYLYHLLISILLITVHVNAAPARVGGRGRLGSWSRVAELIRLRRVELTMVTMVTMVVR